MSDFLENYVEMDLNPVISFSSSGKIIYSNEEAQFLLNQISPNELFDISLKYAPKSFGVKTTYINLKIKNYTFYATTISYKDEEKIHLKLYKSVMVKKDAKLDNKNSEINNIFTLVDLCISSSKLKSNIRYIKNYDPSICPFKLNEKDFIKIFISILESFNDSSVITTKIMLKIGEYIKIQDNKYPLISIETFGNKYVNFNDFSDDEFYPYFIITKKDKTKISIDLPLILK